MNKQKVLFRDQIYFPSPINSMWHNDAHGYIDVGHHWFRQRLLASSAVLDPMLTQIYEAVWYYQTTMS